MEMEQIAKKFQEEQGKCRRKSVNELLDSLSKDQHLRTVLQSNQYARKVLSLMSIMERNNDEAAQEAALDVILASPVYQRLEEDKYTDGLEYTDHLVKQLLKWFKEDFFQWVNKPECAKCGNKDQNKIEGIQPWKPYTDEQREGRASVIERYRCKDCGEVTEFPRYNNPKTLLRTRCGRCGEWDNCFILLMKALGLKVRYLWNQEDHVWCEYYSEKLARWVHLDCCENAFDNPMLYNDGWAKKMSYVFAISDHYIVDVTAKYVDPKLNRALPRDKIGEADLTKVLAIGNLSSLKEISSDSLLLEVSSDIIHDKRNMNGVKPSATGLMAPQTEWVNGVDSE